MANLVTSTRTANALRFAYNTNGREPFVVPIYSGHVVKVGQMVVKDAADPTSNQFCWAMSTGLDTYSNLVGVAMEDHLSTDATGTIQVDVSPRTVYNVQAPADANGYAFGQPLEVASAGGFTKTTATASKDDVMVVVENTTVSTATTIKVKMRYGKSFLDLTEDA